VTWKVSIEYERVEDGVPRMTGGRQYIEDDVLEQAPIGAAATIGMMAEEIYTDVKEAMAL
jgi:hypothetical protein